MVSLLKDPITSFIFWIRSLVLLRSSETLQWPIKQIRRTQNSKKSCYLTSWEPRPPSPTPPQLTIRSPWASTASYSFHRQGCRCSPAGRCNGDFQLSKCILLINLSNFLLPSSTVLLLMIPKAHNLFHSTYGAKYFDCPCSRDFLLIHLCQNVTICFYLCFGIQLTRFCGKELIKKIIF